MLLNVLQMIAGELYSPLDPELVAAHRRAVRLQNEFNDLRFDGNEDISEKRTEILQQLIGKMGDECYIEPPFRCDYGSQIELGCSNYPIFQ